MPIGNFNRNVRPATPAPATPAPETPAKKGGIFSRYGGMDVAADRLPLPQPGLFRFEVVSCAADAAPKPPFDVTCKAQLRIVDCLDADAQSSGHKPGEVLQFLRKFTGSSAYYGIPAVQAFVRAALGYQTEQEQAADGDPDLMVDACLGDSNELSVRGNPIIGRVVDARIRFGQPCRDKEGKPTGDFYRDYEWHVVE